MQGRSYANHKHCTVFWHHPDLSAIQVSLLYYSCDISQGVQHAVKGRLALKECVS
jgi:hypothetical protein